MFHLSSVGLGRHAGRQDCNMLLQLLLCWLLHGEGRGAVLVVGCWLLAAHGSCCCRFITNCYRCRCCCLRYHLLPPLRGALQASVQESVSWMVRLGNSETRVQVGRKGRRSWARQGEQLWGKGSERGAAWGNGLGEGRDGGAA